MEILSVGSCVSSGHYLHHSAFHHVFNFRHSEDLTLISLVHPLVGEGAAHVVLAQWPNQAPTELVLEKDLLNSYPKYSSKTPLSQLNIDNIKEQISLIKAQLSAIAPLDSMAYLWTAPACAVEKLTGVAKVRALHFQKALHLIEQKSYPQFLEGISSLKGVGVGLTPSGDDFNMGFLLARYLKKDSKEKREELLEMMMPKDSFLVSTFLKLSFLGEVPQKYVDIITSLSVTPCSLAKDLFCVGHTSSFDWTVGLIFGLLKEYI